MWEKKFQILHALFLLMISLFSCWVLKTFVGTCFFYRVFDLFSRQPRNRLMCIVPLPSVGTFVFVDWNLQWFESCYEWFVDL